MPSNNRKLTPMMKQWHEIKTKYPDAIVFFRLGDFYETFYEDAQIASRELNITLTSRGGTKNEKTPLAGVPHHALDSYLPRLVKKGYKVAICEQMEEPKPGKLVKREVIRVVTAGTIHEDTYLDDKANNYLMTLCQNNGYGLAFIDISTGVDFFVTQILEQEGIEGILTQIGRFNPSECLIQANLYKNEKFVGDLKRQTEMIFSPYPDINFDPDIGQREIIGHFGTLSLHGFGIEQFPAIIGAAGATLKYLQETQLTQLTNIKSLKPYSTADFMILDAASQRNLELLHNIRDGTSRGTLLEILDHAETAMGGRLLRRWMLQPLINKKQINARLDAVEELISNTFVREEIRTQLGKISDLERLVSRVSYGTANARDLIALRTSLEIIPQLKRQLQKYKAQLLTIKIHEALYPLPEIKGLLFEAIADDPPVSIREGKIIKAGYNEELDELKKISKEGKTWIKNLETQERSKTGIDNLKIGYNKVFGYYIQITKANLRKLKGAAKEYVETQYIRKQTLTTAERYITTEMKEREEKILNAEERINDLEYQLFTDIRNHVAENIESIQTTAQAVAKLDVLVTFAKISMENNYNRPKINDDTIISIKDGRHPVVEKLVYQEPFIPNDTLLDCGENQLLIVTGPNMAGKCITPETIIFSDQGILPIQAFKPEGITEGTFKEFKTTVVGINSPVETSHFYSDGLKPTIKITTRRGYTIEGTYNHPIWVRLTDGKECWRKLDDIKTGDFVTINRKNDLWGSEIQINYEVPEYPYQVRKYPIPENISEDLAYLLGLLIGDGTLTYDKSYLFSTGDEFLKSEFIRINKTLFSYIPGIKKNQKDLFVTSRFLRDFLKYLGLEYHQAQEKEIPLSILKAPKSIIKSFMQGLFDSDGYADKRYGNVEYSTASRKLASQIHHILLNWGIISTLKLKKTARKPSYRVLITGIDSIKFHKGIGFKLPRKKERQKLASSVRMTNIDSIPHLFNVLTTIKQRYLERSHKIPSKYKLKHNKKIAGIFDSYIPQKRNISYFKLKEFIVYCNKCRIDCDELKEIYNNYYFYDKIENVEYSESEVFDFTVPDSHAFVGNGIINHNSTNLRQVALIVLLAQMGSFVPVTEADIGLVDRIFTRVGAFDDITMQRSTFMVEMNEMAYILNNATKRSLIIIDEIGRGTSTFDGLSIAWAVAEYILDSQKIGARTLFATHFHQLIELEEHYNAVKNYNIAVKEEGDTMIFLRKIMPGGTSKSYGIQVANLAGMPQEVIITAQRVLQRLERLAEGYDISNEPTTAPPAPSKVWEKPSPSSKSQTSLISYFESPTEKKLKELDIDSLTPLQALALLAELKEEAKKRK